MREEYVARLESVRVEIERRAGQVGQVFLHELLIVLSAHPPISIFSSALANILTLLFNGVFGLQSSIVLNFLPEGVVQSFKKEICLVVVFMK